MSYRGEFVAGEGTVSVSLRHLSGSMFRVQVGERTYDVEAHRLPDGRVAFELDGKRLTADAAVQRDRVDVRVDGRTWHLEPARRQGASGGAGSGDIEAPMTGTIAEVLVEVGAEVEVGTPIIVVTAMKMEHKLSAGIAGVVSEINAQAGDTVDQGTTLARISPS